MFGNLSVPALQRIVAVGTESIGAADCCSLRSLEKSTRNLDFAKRIHLTSLADNRRKQTKAREGRSKPTPSAPATHRTAR